MVILSLSENYHCSSTHQPPIQSLEMLPSDRPWVRSLRHNGELLCPRGLCSPRWLKQILVLAWFPFAEDCYWPGTNGLVATCSKYTLTCFLPLVSKFFTLITESQSINPRRDLRDQPIQTLILQIWPLEPAEKDSCPRSHSSLMKELGPELLNWRIMYPWCHSSSNRFLCSLPYLAFVYLTHSPHPPGMCQQPARLTWRELTQLNWPRTLYLQSNKCHVTLLETHTVCKDTRDVQVIHHCTSAKSIMLRSKQSGQVIYNVWDFKVLFPRPKIPYYPTTKALILSPQINLFNHKLLLRILVPTVPIW